MSRRIDKLKQKASRPKSLHVVNGIRLLYVCLYCITIQQINWRSSGAVCECVIVERKRWQGQQNHFKITAIEKGDASSRHGRSRGSSVTGSPWDGKEQSEGRHLAHSRKFESVLCGSEKFDMELGRNKVQFKTILY